MTFGELFAGIGGFSLGLERAGMTCKWQVEIDPYATAVLKKHWPDVPKHDDVRTFPPTHTHTHTHTGFQRRSHLRWIPLSRHQHSRKACRPHGI